MSKIVHGRSVPVLCFSMRGLWRCTLSQVTFSEWWPGRVARGMGIVGVDYIEGVNPSGEPDVFVPLLVAPAMFKSTSPLGREARRVVSKALLQAIPQRGAALAADPCLARLIANASYDAGSGGVLDPALVRMADGPLQMPTSPDRVPGALKIARRPLGQRVLPTVSVEGLWSCSAADVPCDSWFARVASDLSLRPGIDYPELSGEAAGTPAYVDILVASSVAAIDRSGSYESVVAAIASAISAAMDPSTGDVSLSAPPGASPPEVAQTRDTAIGVVSTSGSPEVAGVDDSAAGDAHGSGFPPDEPAVADEPWAEAFDFGRLVPVVDREVGGVVQFTVASSDVHTFLAVGRDLPTWFGVAIERSGLVLGIHFEKINSPQIGGIKCRGPVPTDYALTLSAAKKIAMAATGRRGNAVREYFLECERRLEAGEPPISGPVEPVLPAAAAVPPSAPDALGTPFLTQDTFPLVLVSYLFLRGLSLSEATAKARRHELDLLRWLAVCGAKNLSFFEPVEGRWLFTRPALDAWWDCSRGAIMRNVG